MSAYRTQKTSIADGSCLMTALGQMTSPITGKLFKPVKHALAVKLNGWPGDRKTATAEIVLPKAQVGSGDIGFKKQKDGTYLAVINDMDEYRFNAAWLTEVKQRTLEARAAAKAKTQQGMRFESREVQKDGSIRLTYVQA